MIDNVVAALGLGLNLTDEEIADVLWLAVQMQQFGDGEISEQGDRNEALENSVSNRESPKQPAQSLRDGNRDRQDENKEDEQNFEVHSKNAQGDDLSTRRSDELQLKIPDARSLQEPLEVARSLRPLMRRVPSQVNTLLDEEATVRRIAEEKIWCPVLRPALEPWLDLALVIDDSASMLMWRHTIAELQHFLSSYGVFRDVRVWRLGTDKAEKVCIYAGATASDRNGSPRSPSELIEANGRGLVLVVSDCIAPIWRNGAIASALQIWSRSGMVAILQMLPDWLWARTALGRGVAAQFSALAAGMPNYQLTTTTVSTWYDIDLATSIKIPVVTLEPDKFTAWAEMLAGKGGAWSAGIVFEPELFAVPEVSIEFDGASELDAEDRVQSFRLTASPIARRLAGLLAAAPVISLPIVRILQSKVLTQSQPVHVAEVFLGGLLKPLSEITAKTNPNYVQYDFIEGVRDLLLESVPSSEIKNIVVEVSEYIAKRLGVSLPDFAAVIRNPRQVKNTKLTSQTRPFALLTAQILKRLGGEYVRFAKEVERNWLSNSAISKQGENKNISKLNQLDLFREVSNNLEIFPLISTEEITRFRVAYGEETIQELEALVEDSPSGKSKICFAGLRGCGKSTLLAELSHRMEQRYFVVFFSISDTIEMSDVNHINILFAIAVKLMQEIEIRKINIKELIKKSFYQWFADCLGIKDEQFKPLTSIDLDLFQVIVDKLKSEAKTRGDIKQKFIHNISELISRINEISAVIQATVRLQILVIIDDLDKLSLDITSEIFQNLIKALMRLNFTIIFTISYSSLRDINLSPTIENEFNSQIVVMPILKLFKKGESRQEEAKPDVRTMTILKELVYKRLTSELIESELIEPEIIEKIIIYSGGIPREIIRIINGCCRICLRQIRTHKSLLTEDIDQKSVIINSNILEEAINKLSIDFDTRLGKKDYEILEEVYRNYKPSDPSDSRFLDLLNGLYVIEYRNGMLWYDLHPIVANLLKRQLAN
jgi:GTPase SAR1 family protein